MTAVLEPTAIVPRPRNADFTDELPADITDLVARVQAGDTSAFDGIYRRYYDPVFRFIWFRVTSRAVAEDLTSEVFLRALKRIGSFTWQGRDLGAWLITIARNIVADYYKSSRYKLEFLTGDVLDHHESVDQSIEGDPERAATDHLTNETLLAAIDQLNPHQQQCIRLRFLQDLSVKEAADAMGIEEGALKALQFRATRSLYRLLVGDTTP